MIGWSDWDAGDDESLVADMATPVTVEVCAIEVIGETDPWLGGEGGGAHLGTIALPSRVVGATGSTKHTRGRRSPSSSSLSSWVCRAKMKRSRRWYLGVRSGAQLCRFRWASFPVCAYMICSSSEGASDSCCVTLDLNGWPEVEVEGSPQRRGFGDR